MRTIPEVNFFVNQVTPDQKENLGIWARLSESKTPLMFVSKIDRPVASIRYEASVENPQMVKVEVTPSALAFQKNLEFNSMVELTPDRPEFRVHGLVISLKPIQGAAVVSEFGPSIVAKDHKDRLFFKQEIPTLRYSLEIKDEFGTIILG